MSNNNRGLHRSGQSYGSTAEAYRVPKNLTPPQILDLLPRLRGRAARGRNLPIDLGAWRSMPSQTTVLAFCQLCHALGEDALEFVQNKPEGSGEIFAAAMRRFFN